MLTSLESLSSKSSAPKRTSKGLIIPEVPVPQSIQHPPTFSQRSRNSRSGSITIILEPRHHAPRINFFIKVDFPEPDLPMMTAVELFLLLVLFHKSKNIKLYR